MFVYSEILLDVLLSVRFCRAILMFSNMITAHISDIFNLYLDIELYFRMCLFNIKCRSSCQER